MGGTDLEAGAVITDMNGTPWSDGAGGVLVTSTHLHGRMLDILTDGDVQQG
ncbi:hypothetical protein ACGF8B_25380 [Streptomyces sp. NPDC047917]|uniref:hypothetical protein n=1 Tax=Streptomyces sp. NPDC047917 TaxID=3365491 RepID=UPI003723D85E